MCYDDFGILIKQKKVIITVASVQRLTYTHGRCYFWLMQNL